MVQTYLQYNDPLLIHWRKGTEDDPYKDRMDSLPVINNQITLLEIPSKAHRVHIAGYTEVDMDTFNRNRKRLNPNEFLVDYSVGSIQFNPSEEGKTLLVSYKGKGIIMYPASRIYAMVSRKPDIVKTLQDIIDEINSRIDTINRYIDQANIIIQEAKAATVRANMAADNANEATYNANIATQAAYDAAQTAIEAAESSIMIYKDPVNRYSDLFTVYPNPENGWRVMVLQTGDIYRYNSTTRRWELIENYTGAPIPYVSETTSGILHTHDYLNFRRRRVIFSLPKIRDIGVQNILIQFPFNGEIKSASAFCNVSANLYVTEISIEKIGSEGFDSEDNWDSIFSQNIMINPNEHKGTEPIISNKIVNAGDYFRINIIQLDRGIQGVTVQLDIDTLR